MNPGFGPLGDSLCGDDHLAGPRMDSIGKTRRNKRSFAQTKKNKPWAEQAFTPRLDDNL